MPAPRPLLAGVPCQLPLTDGPRMVLFRYLEGRHLSDAVVAVSYGSGRSVYAVAISMPRVPGAPLDVRPAALPTFRGLRPRILGWADRPELDWPGSVAPTALRRYWSLDGCSHPGRRAHDTSWREGDLAMTELTCAGAFNDGPWTHVKTPGGREYGLEHKDGTWWVFARGGELVTHDASRATALAGLRQDAAR